MDGKGKVMHQKGILEALREKIGCDYISNLHYYEHNPTLKKQILEMDMSRYTMEQWNDAIKYLWNVPVHFTNEQEIRQYVLKK